jgi:L-seryl-tRNA(Ser) seleniumtransferase
MDASRLRTLPSVDAVMGSDAMAQVQASGAILREAAREAVDRERTRVRERGEDADFGRVVADAAARARDMVRPGLRRVLNATGVVVHTNLGRAPLAPDATAAALGACNLEYDLGRGRRGSRRDHVESVLCALSGAEAALVVNNNAAAMVLALAALAGGREVIVSRGELVEIGGGFRVPDILATSGARLRDVGTTNRTYLSDYEGAIGPDTAMLLRVHPSNFRTTGFVHTPADAELAALARSRGLAFVHDLGSGTFAPLPAPLDRELDPCRAVAAGPDLVCFSGDKVLGGPQAGILLGTADAIGRCARHPLARALRVDKLALAALEATLLAYRAGQPERVPVWRMLNADVASLRARADAIASELADADAAIEIIACEDAVGAGSHPDVALDGVALALAPRQISAQALADRLRLGTPAVIGVLAGDRMRLHLRAIEPADDDALTRAVAHALIGATLG